MNKARCQRFAFCFLEPGHADDCEVRLQGGFQESFSASSADGGIGGGAAGAGKSALLLIEPLRWIHVRGFTCVVLRKEQRDLEDPGGLWAKSLELYPAFGGEPKASEYKWTFPSGATVQFGFVNSKTYRKDWQGPEICLLLFDELTHFAEREVRYLLTRNRSSCGVRAYWRATCNPDRDSWVRRWVDWWIQPPPARGFVMPGRAGAVRYYLRRGGKEHWADSKEELLRQFPTAHPDHVKSLTYIPGSLRENRFLGADYEGKLLEQEEEDVARLLEGDWNAGSGAVGKWIKEDWFRRADGSVRPDRLVDAAPPETVWMRPWDLAATPEEDDPKASCTAGPLLGLCGDRLYVADLVVDRWDAGRVEDEVLAAAQWDAENIGGAVKYWICRERNGAGKAVLARYVKLLKGRDVDGGVEAGTVEQRLRPFVAQAKHGNVYLVRERPGRPWIATFLTHLLRLPDGPDDVAAALAEGYRVLAEGAEFGSVPTPRQVQDVITATGIVPATPIAPRQGRGAGAGVGPGRFRLAPAWGASKPPGRGR